MNCTKCGSILHQESTVRSMIDSSINTNEFEGVGGLCCTCYGQVVHGEKTKARQYYNQRYTRETPYKERWMMRAQIFGIMAGCIAVGAMTGAILYYQCVGSKCLQPEGVLSFGLVTLGQFILSMICLCKAVFHRETTMEQTPKPCGRFKHSWREIKFPNTEPYIYKMCNKCHYASIFNLIYEGSTATQHISQFSPQAQMRLEQLFLSDNRW